MSATLDLRTLLDVIADHPVLPPPGSLPPDGEELRAALGEIARGSRSRHASLIREVAASHRVGLEELVRRAGFVLACVSLPSHGTHYDLLGVTPRASSREIRQRWATLIQRYHPDHAGPEGGLGDQARRLIEAYQTLRDPDRRRQYDFELSRAQGEWRVATPVEAPGSWRKLAPPGRWRWAPAAIVAFGVIVVVVIVRWTSHPPATTIRPALRETPPVMGDAAPGESWLVQSPPSPHRAGIGAGTVEPKNIGPPPASQPAPLLPSLLSRIPGPESAPAPSAAGATLVAEVRRDEERREPSAGGVASLPAPSWPATLEPPPPPVVPDVARGAERSNRDVAVPLAAPGSRPTAPATASPTAPAPGRRPQQETGAPPSTPVVATTPPRSEPKKPTLESWPALIEAFRSAYERKDVGGLTDLFANDVRERNTVGRGAVQQLYVTNFQVLDRIRYEVSQVTARAGSKEGEVLVQGRFRIRAVDARSGSRPLEVSGPIRWTLRRDGEALRIVGIDYDAGTR